MVAALTSAAQHAEVEATVYDDTAADSGPAHHAHHAAFATASAEWGLGEREGVSVVDERDRSIDRRWQRGRA